MKSRGELLEVWRSEEGQPFEGWDFSYLNGRMIEEKEPWDYLSRAAALMIESTSVLEMDTGGGERFIELKEHWPDKVVATEEYLPNLALAEKRLCPLGAKVLSVHITEDAPLPFEDGEFDLILNRHSSFNSEEISRTLSTGGVFLTQQVHGMYAWDLLEYFGAKPKWPDVTGSRYVPRLTSAGLTIHTYKDWAGSLEFTDVGAIVYYLKAVAWYVPDFSVNRYADNLMALQDRLERQGSLVFEARKYLIEAHKPVG